MSAHDSLTGALMAIGIREATDADLPSIVEIVNLAIASSPYVWTEIPTTLDARRIWLEDHQRSGHPIFVAFASGRPGHVVGWSSLSTFRGRDGYRFTAEVSVYVHPSAQRQGVAARLIQAIEEAGTAQGLHALVAVIDAAHAASISLFERFSFAERGRLAEVGWKFGEWRDEVFMVKLLTAGGANAA
ncbi:MAG TPA: GNAT family N-acetyltransferase [Gemmatimonadaceae bacterium]